MPSATDLIAEWARGPAPAVIFDFNGTLSDDEPILFDIFRALFRDHLGWDMSADEYRDRLLGLSDREIVQRAVAAHGHGDGQVAELIHMRRILYQQRVAEHNPIAEDTVQLVKLMSDNGIAQAVVTGAQRDDVLAVLSHSPAGAALSVLVTEEDVTNGKPDPEGFLAAAALLERRPADVLVFEDSVPGVRGALAAGMRCVAVAAHPTPELTACAPATVTALSPALVAGALSGRRRVR
jgi:beta-phosphoglucomutase